MIAFFKSAGNIRLKLAAVCALNATDVLLTLALVRTGAFIEGNPVMALFMGSSGLALIVKLTLPALLSVLLAFRLRGASAAQLKTSNRLICVLLGLYALVNLSHIVWGAVYFAVQPLL